MIAALQTLASLKAWVLAPVAHARLPLAGGVGILDFLLHDPVAKAGERDFFAGRAGESLLVAPGDSPLAGVLLLGYGEAQLGWVEAMQIALQALPAKLPGASAAAAILPPAPVRDRLPVDWSKAGERFVPTLRAKLPQIKQWLWLDLTEGAL